MNLRKIDVLVAKYIMGIDFKQDPDDENPRAILRSMVKKYSTDIRSAWEVVEKLRTMDNNKYQILDIRWVESWEIGYSKPPKDNYLLAEDKDICVAICLAALAAKGVEIGDFI